MGMIKILSSSTRASHRFKRNKIEALENSSGSMCSNEEEIAEILINFYQNLFTSENPRRIDEALESNPRVVTEEMNQMLSGEFTRAKVEEALKQMDPLKAPGLDGMPPIFFQHFWPCVGDEVAGAMLNCLNSGSFPSSINHNSITLIPKTKNPTKVPEYRPIVLCSIIYKIVSKVATNRLKKILPQLISLTRSAFSLINLSQTIFW